MHSAPRWSARARSWGRGDRVTTRDDKARHLEALARHANASGNEGPLPGATHESTAKNPLCGDRVTVRVRVEDGVIREARFEARGCMIARASSSLMTASIVGRGIDEALLLVGTRDALIGDDPPPADVGALEPLRGARDFQARRGCVTLPWRALEAAFVGPPSGPGKGEALRYR